MATTFTPLLIGVILLSAAALPADDDCDIEALLEPQDLPYGTLAVDGYGTLVEAERLLIPVDLETGTYDISISREDRNLYRVNGADLFVQTRHCYEYATREDAILKVESHSGYTLGRLVFLD